MTSGKRDVKGRPYSGGAFDFDDPSVVIADTLADGEANTQHLALCYTTEIQVIKKMKIETC